MRTGTGVPDGIAMLAASRRGLLDRLGDIAPDGAAWADAMVRLCLLLELRWKLEELLLFPALHDALAPDTGALAALAGEVAPLRECADALRASPPPERAERLNALRKLARAHLDGVALLLARPAIAQRLDAPRLGRDIEGLLDRWADEVARTGDIEDEERDPVGLPPR